MVNSQSYAKDKYQREKESVTKTKKVILHDQINKLICSTSRENIFRFMA